VSEVGQWDHVALRLQEWRKAADDPSYADIAARIAQARLARGATPAAAQVGRTTVYDVFRLGRSRINTALVREIADALGVEQIEVDELLEAPATAPAPTQAAASEPELIGPSTPRAFTTRSALMVMLLGLGLNLLGRETVNFLQLPIYLDMVGTALVAVVLGPWRGAAVGASTNVVGVLHSGVVSLPFAVVNVAGALLWGYGVHRWGMGRTLARFFTLSAFVAVVCSLLAVPILFLMFDGSIGHSQDDLTENLMELTSLFVIALSIGNLLTSLIDKLISGFAALVGASMLGIQLATEPSRVSRPPHRDATTV
jgi:energy-coupling factor transport system substrate-specific component